MLIESVVRKELYQMGQTYTVQITATEGHDGLVAVVGTGRMGVHGA
jgi:uncharacterized protein YxjI